MVYRWTASEVHVNHISLAAAKLLNGHDKRFTQQMLVSNGAKRRACYNDEIEQLRSLW